MTRRLLTQFSAFVLQEVRGYTYTERELTERLVPKGGPLTLDCIWLVDAGPCSAYPFLCPCVFCSDTRLPVAIKGQAVQLLLGGDHYQKWANFFVRCHIVRLPDFCPVKRLPHYVSCLKHNNPRTKRHAEFRGCGQHVRVSLR